MKLTFELIVLTLVVAFILYDWLHDKANEWCEQSKYVRRSTLYPWWITLDWWIYHVEACRVGTVIHEQHRWFGGRVRRIGNPINFYGSAK